MKQPIYALLFTILNFPVYAQVGVGTDSPDESALLDVSGTTGGFLPPRLTYDQMNNIVLPAEGLMVYCTNCYPKGMYYFDGSDFLSGITGNTSLVPPLSRNHTIKTGKTQIDGNSDASPDTLKDKNATLDKSTYLLIKDRRRFHIKVSDSISKLTN